MAVDASRMSLAEAIRAVGLHVTRSTIEGHLRVYDDRGLLNVMTPGQIWLLLEQLHLIEPRAAGFEEIAAEVMTAVAFKETV